MTISSEREDNLSWAPDVPAPTDADGRLVPLSVKNLFAYGGKKVTVEEIVFDGAWWYVKCLETTRLRLSRFHLYKPDSWESLEEDVQRVAEFDDTCGYFGHANKPCDGCPAFATSELCLVAALRDVLRRAKALAGVRDRD